jgi:predicted nucleic acid-binding protein
VAHYFDTSALVKLVVLEPESDALLAWATTAERVPVASDLTRTELLRAVRQADPTLALRAREVLGSLTLLAVTSAILNTAGRLEPAALRSLDAIHLASALDLGDDLDAVVTYDVRMADACRALGLSVTHPGL